MSHTIYAAKCDNSSTYTFTTKKSVICTGASANEIIPSMNRSFVYKAKEERHVRIGSKSSDYARVILMKVIPETC